MESMRGFLLDGRLSEDKQSYGRQGSETMYRNQKQSEKHERTFELAM